MLCLRWSWWDCICILITSSTKQPMRGLGVTEDYLKLCLNTMLQSHKLIFIITNMNTTRQ